METQYQRGKIQEESMHYEMMKHDGSLPIIGVNTYVNPATLADGYEAPKIELARASKEEKELQIANLRDFQQRHSDRSAEMLALGQITRALYQVGGQYRRNM